MRISAFLYRKFISREQDVEIEIPGEYDTKNLTFKPDQIVYLIEYGKPKKAMDIDKLHITEQERFEIESYAFRWYIKSKPSFIREQLELDGENIK